MGYELFSFQNNPKNLDLSYKMNLDLKDCLGCVGRVSHIIAKFLISDFVIYRHSREGKLLSYSQVNMVL